MLTAFEGRLNMRRIFYLPPILALVVLIWPVAALSSDSATSLTGLPEKSPNLVAIISDYGTKDFYAGALEGAIYSENPSVKISTITHEVEPFNVAEGSYLLSQAAKMYPTGTVFIAAVDPGSGETRSIVLESGDGKLFVAPDNGILTGVMDELGTAHIYEIANQSFMMMDESGENHTSQSWYIYAPAAARLAEGASPRDVGPEIFDPVRLSEVEAEAIESSISESNTNESNINESSISDSSYSRQKISGSVVHIDRFGNMITNIPGSMMKSAGYNIGDNISVAIGDKKVDVTFVSTYGDVPEGDWLVLIDDSLGAVEIARNMENAAETIGGLAGDEVQLM
jgi:S-adenosylmethionine hydrolase